MPDNDASEMDNFPEIERDCFATYRNGRLIVETDLRMGETDLQISEYIRALGIQVPIEVYPLTQQQQTSIPPSHAKIDSVMASSLNELVELSLPMMQKVDAAANMKINGQSPARRWIMNNDADPQSIEEAILRTASPSPLKNRN